MLRRETRTAEHGDAGIHKVQGAEVFYEFAEDPEDKAQFGDAGVRTFQRQPFSDGESLSKRRR